MLFCNINWSELLVIENKHLAILLASIELMKLSKNEALQLGNMRLSPKTFSVDN